MITSLAQRRRREAGFSYVEVLIATVLIATALVPALEAIQHALAAARFHEELTQQNYHTASRMQELAAESFSALDEEAVAVADPKLPTSYSDAPGSPMRRVVHLARYDGDDDDGDGNPFTGGDGGLLWLRVSVEGSAHGFETLRAR